MKFSFLISMGACFAVVAGIVRPQSTPPASTSPIRHTLDHIVVAVRSLDEAKAAYETLGFTVSPPSAHPFGTTNRLIVFDTNFLELLALTNANGQSPFAPFIQSLNKREGVYSIGLTSLNIQEDYEALKKRGAAAFEPFSIERRVTLPDGSEGIVSAAATGWFPEQVRLARLFYSQQLRPQYIWTPEWQRHANGSTSLRSITIVAEQPAEYQSYFESMILGGAIKSEKGYLVATTPAGLIELVTPTTYARRYQFASIKSPVPLPQVAVKIAVANLAATRAYLAARKIPFVAGAAGSLVITPNRESGLLIEFVR